MIAARKVISAICVTAVVSGCASYQPEPISPADNARALDGRALEDQRLHDFLAAEIDDDAGRDPAQSWDLPTLTLAALYFHPEIAIARAKLAGASLADDSHNRDEPRGRRHDRIGAVRPHRDGRDVHGHEGSRGART